MPQSESGSARGRTVQRRRSSFFSPSPSPPPPGEREALAFASDSRHFSMLRQLQPADYITMMNCYCGFNSVVCSARHIAALAADPATHYISWETTWAYRAMFYTFLGFFFDIFDGRVARWQNKSSLMGKELDSLADLVSFGVAPALIAFSIGLDTRADIAVLSFFVLCGLLRLARFNVTAAILSKGSLKVSHFEGIPIPSSLALVAGMAALLRAGTVHDHIPGGQLFAGTMLAVHPLVFVFFTAGCMMVSKSLKITKV